MNIVVLSSRGYIYTRPDTTWERDNEDFYAPDFVDRLNYSPILFARISKPGKNISANFAHRYYDAINFGVFLYPQSLLDLPVEGWACANCLDHTSLLPYPLYNPITLGEKDNRFELSKIHNGEKQPLFSCQAPEKEKIEEAISLASSHCYLRCGDLLAIELQEMNFLCEIIDEEIHICGSYCENPTIDFKIIY
ncbi:MAG: hypothetical protein ACI4TL_04820 [Candidatus Cryptobacteroides sp.]